MSRLKANESHPTFKKINKLFEFLGENSLDLEWIDGGIKIKDYQHAVTFDLVDEDNIKINYVPPLFEHKLTRENIKNKHCKCIHCDSNYKGNYGN